MPHLLAGPSTLICIHQGVSPFGNTQSRCHIFWLVHPLSFVFTKVSHLLATPSQDATFLAGPSISFVFIKVSHLLVTPSQDATSFGWSIRHHYFCVCQNFAKSIANTTIITPYMMPLFHHFIQKQSIGFMRADVVCLMMNSLIEEAKLKN